MKKCQPVSEFGWCMPDNVGLHTYAYRLIINSRKSVNPSSFLLKQKKKICGSVGLSFFLKSFFFLFRFVGTGDRTGGGGWGEAERSMNSAR